MRRSVTGYTSIWKTTGGPPASRASCATTAARSPPALSPTTATRVGSPSSSVAWATDHSQGGERVVDRGRELVLGREPVVDAHDDDPGPVGQHPALVVVGVEVADHEAAAVEEDGDAEGRVVRGRVDPQGQRTPGAREWWCRRPTPRPPVTRPSRGCRAFMIRAVFLDGDRAQLRGIEWWCGVEQRGEFGVQRHVGHRIGPGRAALCVAVRRSRRLLATVKEIVAPGESMPAPLVKIDLEQPDRCHAYGAMAQYFAMAVLSSSPSPW